MTLRWFTNSLSTGEVTAVYKSEWNNGFPVSEHVWTRNDWMPCEAISKWNFFGDIAIDEINEAEAQALIAQFAKL